jgi:two-component system cell cycle sensor histidine kinase/response regulator CckA
MSMLLDSQEDTVNDAFRLWNANKPTTFPIVTIIASIGALDAFKKLFLNLPLNTGMAFVIIGHLDHSQPMDFPNFLKTHTDIPIFLIDSGLQVQPNAIYINRPDRNPVIKNGMFYYQNSTNEFDADYPMNLFLDSLVQDQQQNIIAIILSGFGKINTSLLREIKDNGMVIAQDPSTAKYDYMPRNAIDSGCVNYVLPAEDIAEQVLKFSSYSKPKKSAAYSQLRNQTDFLLNKVFSSITDKDIYQLVSDFNNYQIELELQNEELLRSQLELEESRNKYIDLYDFAPTGYFTLDEHGLITEVNQLGADLFGVNKNALVDKNFSRYVAINYQDIFYTHKKNVLSDMKFETCEVKLLKRNDAMFYARLNSRSVMNSLTGQKQILTFISDITVHKISEELRDERQVKLTSNNLTRSMTELTTKIAHDINQPIAAIYNYLNGCIRRLEKGDFQVDEILKALNNAVNQSHRTNEIILRMKNFSCKDVLYYESVCINKIINEAISLINYEIADFSLEINYREINYHSSLMLDKIHIQQVILNLLRNSIEAMRDEKTREPKLIIETNILSKSEIEICIMDNGPGIKAENIPKLFDPHFTTKSYGIGLGLAVSRVLVEAHGGTLSILSDPVYGTSAKILLPIRI